MQTDIQNRTIMSGLLKSIHLDFSDISAERLNIEAKERSNLFPWNGQFSPQFIEVLLEQYVCSGMSVLDPFCGSGTVLYESARFGLRATGIEVNPAAYLLARSYGFCNVTKSRRMAVIDKFEQRLSCILDTGLFAIVSNRREKLPSDGEDFLALVADGMPEEQLLLETFVILADFYKGVDMEKLRKTWSRLRKIIENLPYSQERVRVIIGDGRYPEDIGQFDVVITSPPYINVYNYHQQYRASAEALGWNLLEIAKTEIGSNRKNRGNRFLTVIQYCLDLTITLENLWDVTNQDARLIFILGRESLVRGVPFLNGEIFARLAVEAVGYEIILRQERVFTNRFGQRIYEDILHFKKVKRHIDSDIIARTIAEQVLRDSMLLIAIDDVLIDIKNAIQSVNTVKSSPRFNAARSHKEGKLRDVYDISNAPS